MGAIFIVLFVLAAAGLVTLSPQLFVIVTVVGLVVFGAMRDE